MVVNNVLLMCILVTLVFSALCALLGNTNLNLDSPFYCPQYPMEKYILFNAVAKEQN